MVAIWPASMSRWASSITGPTSVDGFDGIAQLELARGALDHLDHLIGDILLHEQEPQCRSSVGPAERKADITTSSATCSASAVASTIMALSPPVSAMNGTIGPVPGGERPVDGARRLGRAGKGHATGSSDARSTRQPTSPAPGTGKAEHPSARRPLCRIWIASWATSGVCSAGLAITALPAASPADT